MDKIIRRHSEMAVFRAADGMQVTFAGDLNNDTQRLTGLERREIDRCTAKKRYVRKIANDLDIDHGAGT